MTAVARWRGCRHSPGGVMDYACGRLRGTIMRPDRGSEAVREIAHIYNMHSSTVGGISTQRTYR